MRVNVVRLSKSPLMFLKQCSFEDGITLTAHVFDALKYESVYIACEVAKSLLFKWPEAYRLEYDHYEDGSTIYAVDELNAIKQIISAEIQLSGYGEEYYKKLRWHLQRLANIDSET